jgi:hypothetical protein
MRSLRSRLRRSVLARCALALGLVGAVSTAAPAWACGCGAYVPGQGTARVSDEMALVTWDGHQEQITLRLTVQSSSATAALIVPTPAPATVELADPNLFRDLGTITQPIVKKRRNWFPSWWHDNAANRSGPSAGAAGGAPPVSVVSRQDLGPLDVVTLSATDAGALQPWLDTNGFVPNPRLAEVARPYVDEGWTFMAARLRPEADAALAGTLQPIRLNFASSQVVYPMRLSALATTTQQLTLYLLADHRLDPVGGGGSIAFADWVEPKVVAPLGPSPLRPIITSRRFLTKYTEAISDPARITSDERFSVAADDGVVREVIYEDVDVRIAGMAPILAGIVFVFGAAVIVALVRAARSGRWSAPPPAPPT